jgi:glutamate/tyrosine decarboxylase-like PLP-dependent enzyme
LKVWLALRLVGRDGYVRMIRDDIALAQALYQRIQTTEELQAFTQNLSIATFRFVPADLPTGDEAVESYLNDLNCELLNRLQAGGEAYVSNAVVDGTFLLRACIVNFRTELADVEALPDIVVRLGRAVDAEMRPAPLKSSRPLAVAGFQGHR